MTYPAWHQGEFPLDEHGQYLQFEGFPTPRWADLVGQLPLLSRQLTLCLPCVGIDGGSNGLQSLGWRSGEHFVPKFVLDTQAYLGLPLSKVHGSLADSFLLGPEKGNILKADISSWDRVDGIIVGPPCPPFSTIGPGCHVIT